MNTDTLPPAEATAPPVEATAAGETAPSPAATASHLLARLDDARRAASEIAERHHEKAEEYFAAATEADYGPVRDHQYRLGVHYDNLGDRVERYGSVLPEHVGEAEGFTVIEGQDRNAPCLCGSGKKAKNCCIPRARALRSLARQQAVSAWGEAPDERTVNLEVARLLSSRDEASAIEIAKETLAAQAEAAAVEAAAAEPIEAAAAEPAPKTKKPRAKKAKAATTTAPAEVAP